MNELLPLETITERDVDLLLHEELSVSPEFVSWLLTASGVPPLSLSSARAWHSVSDPELGESDLLLLALADDKKVAVLIENKVDAVPQPGQSGRYKQRGQKGVAAGDWHQFRTVIIAPKKYLQNDSEARRYDAQVSYESVADWFSSSDDPRRAYKANVLRQAIEQNRRGYNPKMDPTITKFFHDYWMLASRYFPELNTEDPGARTATSSWISFRPDTIPKEFKIWHKIDYNQVDLELPFGADEVDRLKERYSSQLPSDIEIVGRGKKSGLRTSVPSMDRFLDFSEQQDKAFHAMKAAIRLASLFRVLNGA
jgi:hypothetical protein